MIKNKENIKDADILEESVLSRQYILECGLFDKLSELINNLIINHNENFEIVDSGCGTGYYNNKLFDFLKENGKNPIMDGFDISFPAIELAKKLYKNINFFIADVNNIPIKNNSKDIILAMLTKKNYQEYKRILKKNGKLYIVGYDVKKHFKEILGDYIKQRINKNVEKQLKENNFELLNKNILEYNIKLNNEQIKNIVNTIPYRFELDQNNLNNILKLDSLILTMSFIIYEAKINN